MKWFMNLRISVKLISSFVLVAIIAGVVGFWGIKNIRHIDAMDTELYEVNTVPLAYLGDMATYFQRIRVNLRDMIIDREPAAKKKYLDRIKDLDTKLTEQENLFEKSIHSDEVKKDYERYTNA